MTADAGNTHAPTSAAARFIWGRTGSDRIAVSRWNIPQTSGHREYDIAPADGCNSRHIIFSPTGILPKRPVGLASSLNPYCWLTGGVELGSATDFFPLKVRDDLGSYPAKSSPSVAASCVALHAHQHDRSVAPCLPNIDPVSAKCLPPLAKS